MRRCAVLGSCVALLGTAVAAPPAPPRPGAGRVEENISGGWRFARGSHAGAKTVGFDDSRWREVRLPHDWAIEGPFDPEQEGHQAKLPWQGEGWYRRTFEIGAALAGKRVLLLFDGVMAFPTVYLNGEVAGRWDYGYNSFWLDVTDKVRFGAGNTLAVHVDTRKHWSRWYPGAGIYRKVTMLVVDPVHVPVWGVHVTTPEVGPESARVRVRTTVANRSGEACDAVLTTSIVGPSGNRLAGGKQEVAAGAGRETEVGQTFVIRSPRRWDVESPVLYTVESSLHRDGPVRDRVETSFGIRSFRWTADDGFHLNGRRVQLKGVNLHHGHGPLGARFLPRAMERQLEIMRDMGVNAIRTSHNPPAPELLELCDRMGLLVFDEGFDKWDGTAGLHDADQFEPFMERQIRNFMLRDRNHPSIVVWSIGNELWDIEWNHGGDAAEKVAWMVRAFKRFDDSRPVTMGCFVPEQCTKENHIIDPPDFTSWNYGRKYLNARRVYPDEPIIYSESASAVSTRGFYELPHPTEKTDYSETAQVDSYDLNSASGPRDIADVDFRRMEIDRYVAGEFVWTGFDYLGEPTPFAKEARSSYFGIVDLCGIPKDRYYLYRSYWAPEKPTVHILPHWNWPQRRGGKVPVYVYTNGDEAELFVNGNSQGRRRKRTGDTPPGVGTSLPPYYRDIDRYRLRWEEVVHEPGVVRAVAYRNGRRIGEAAVRTAGPAARLRLTPDRIRLTADGDDLCYVLVEMVDKDGVVCPLAGDTVTFSVDGPAAIAGIGNGNPLCLDSFTDASHPLFHGKAMLILRTVADRAGTIAVTAAAKGVGEPARIQVTSDNARTSPDRTRNLSRN